MLCLGGRATRSGTSLTIQCSAQFTFTGLVRSARIPPTSENWTAKLGRNSATLQRKTQHQNPNQAQFRITAHQGSGRKSFFFESTRMLLPGLWGDQLYSPVSLLCVSSCICLVCPSMANNVAVLIRGVFTNNKQGRGPKSVQWMLTKSCISTIPTLVFLLESLLYNLTLSTSVIVQLLSACHRRSKPYFGRLISRIIAPKSSLAHILLVLQPFPILTKQASFGYVPQFLQRASMAQCAENKPHAETVIPRKKGVEQ